MKLTRNLGLLLLAIWLILTGLIPLLNFSFSNRRRSSATGKPHSVS